MRNAVVGAFAGIAFAGCLAETNETADEHVGGSGEALSSSAAVMPPTEATTPPIELPVWHVYLAGRENHGHVYSDEIDLDGHVVAVREADDKGPHKVVHLYLQDHWMGGDKWIEDTIAAGKLTALDLLVITSEILKKHGVLLPPPPGIVHSTTGTRIDDGGDWRPFPGLPGSSDPHGGPTAGSSNPNRSGGAQHGASSGGTNGGSRGRGGSAPVGRRDPHDEAYRNGVRRNDSYAGDSPYPTSYSGVPGYEARGERPVLFKCEGTVYYDDKSACPDFAGGSIGRKWGDKLSRWQGHHFDLSNGGIAMSKEDWITICKFASTATWVLACSAGAFACAEGGTITLGALSLPCAAWWGTLCALHSGVGAGIAERCHIAMGAR